MRCSWCLLACVRAVSTLREETDAEAIQSRLAVLQALAHHRDSEALEIAREHGLPLAPALEPAEPAQGRGGPDALPRGHIRAPAATHEYEEVSIRGPAHAHNASEPGASQGADHIRASAANASAPAPARANVSLAIRAGGAAPKAWIRDWEPAPGASPSIRDGPEDLAVTATGELTHVGLGQVREARDPDGAPPVRGSAPGRADVVDELAREVEQEVKALVEKEAEAEQKSLLDTALGRAEQSALAAERGALSAVGRAEQQAHAQWQQSRLVVLLLACCASCAALVRSCLTRLGVLSHPPPCLVSVHRVELEPCLPRSHYVVCAAETPVRSATYAALKRAAGPTPRSAAAGGSLSCRGDPPQLLVFRAPTPLERQATKPRVSFVDAPERGAGDAEPAAAHGLGAEYLAVGLCDVVAPDGPANAVHELVVRDPQGWNVCKLHVSVFRGPCSGVLALGFSPHAPWTFLRAVQHSFDEGRKLGPVDRRQVLSRLLTCELVVEPSSKRLLCSFEVLQRRSGRWFWTWYAGASRTHALGQLPLEAVKAVFAEEQTLRVVYKGAGPGDQVLELGRREGDGLRDGPTVAKALELLQDTLVGHRGPWLDLQNPRSPYPQSPRSARSAEAPVSKGASRKPIAI